jgi:hypothetical protein
MVIDCRISRKCNLFEEEVVDVQLMPKKAVGIDTNDKSHYRLTRIVSDRQVPWHCHLLTVTGGHQ